MSAEPGALPAAALEQVILAVRDLDINEVRGKIARREAEGPATGPQAIGHDRQRDKYPA